MLNQRAKALLRHPLGVAALAFGLLGLLALLPDGAADEAGLPLMRLGLALLGILALVLAALPLLKRLPGGDRRHTGRMRCEEQLALDAKHRLALVSVDGRSLLLSLQSDGVSLIKDLGQESATLAVDPAEIEFPARDKLAALLAERPEL